MGGDPNRIYAGNDYRGRKFTDVEIGASDNFRHAAYQSASVTEFLINVGISRKIFI